MPSTLATTLQRLIDEGHTSAKEIGELTGVAPSTVYRWISGDSEPPFNSIRMLVRHLPNPAAQREILATFVAGTPWYVFESNAELDVNRDGTIDTADALDSSVDAVHAAGETLIQVREACRDGKITEIEYGTLINRINEVIRQCCTTEGVITQLKEATQKRRVAK